MTILEDCECGITINDNVVAEYDCPPAQDGLCADRAPTPPRTIRKYIESQTDQNFAIRLYLHKYFQFRDGFNTLRCDVFVDGKLKDNVLLVAAMRSPDGTITRDTSGPTQYTDGKWERCKFRFSRLTEDDAYDSSIRVSTKQLGDIKVRVTRVTTELKPQIKTQNDKQLSTPRLTEKSAKGRAVDSFTSLDAPIETATPTVLTITKVDTSILATFIFHYRSKENLQQLGIVEMPLSRRHLGDRDPAGLKPEEVLELVRRQKELLRQQEDTMKVVKQRLQQSEARNSLTALSTLKRARSAVTTDDNGEVNEDVQIVKKAKPDKKIEVVELE